MFFLLFRDLFRDEDFSMYNISEEDFGYVANGIDAKMYVIKINNDDVDREISKAIKYQGYTKAIAVIKFKDFVDDEKVGAIIDKIKDNLECGASLKYIAKVDKEIEDEIKVILIASK